MTTRVTIEPAGHRIEVTMKEGPEDNPVVMTDILEPGTPTKDYWLFTGRSITSIQEIPAADPI